MNAVRRGCVRHGHVDVQGGRTRRRRVRVRTPVIGCRALVLAIFMWAEVETLRGYLGTLPNEIDRGPDERAIFDLARRHDLIIYDGAYLELALRRRMPFATLDRALITRARAEGAPLVRGA